VHVETLSIRNEYIKEYSYYGVIKNVILNTNETWKQAHFILLGNVHKSDATERCTMLSYGPTLHLQFYAL
jgi:hypothetical protein